MTHPRRKINGIEGAGGCVPTVAENLKGHVSSESIIEKREREIMYRTLRHTCQSNNKVVVR